MGYNTNEHEIGAMQTVKFLDEHIEFFYEEIGPERYKQNAPSDVINSYKGKLPETLLTYWKEYGWCGYGNGVFWTVNPDEYKSVVSEWLKDTPFQDCDNYYLIAIGGFGEMFLWGEKTGPSLTITASYGMIFPTDKKLSIQESGGMEFLMKLFFSGIDKEDLDVKDNEDKPLFERARVLLGELKPGEIYGFSPALIMGGEADIKHLKRVNAVAHLHLLAALGEKMIMKDIVKEINENNETGLM